MSRSSIIKFFQLPLSSNAMITVDRAISELRRGGLIKINANDGSSALILAAEMASEETLNNLKQMSHTMPFVVITGQRAAVLGLTQDKSQVAIIISPNPLNTVYISNLIDPLNDLSLNSQSTLYTEQTPNWANGAITLIKLTRLLPAFIAIPTLENHADLFHVNIADVFSYQETVAYKLKRVAEARVPLINAKNTRVIAFRPSDGGIEHLAIIIGNLDQNQSILTRLHSKCFTGDLLGSLRCDCNDQLRGAIAQLSKNGNGILLYLAQEGRSIGLINKIRAYQLQDNGFDTLDANKQLGFDEDERIYLPAVEILHLLNITRIRLLTNNPRKVEELSRHGIEITERVSITFPSNNYNSTYLRTKETRSGHLFK